MTEWRERGEINWWEGIQIEKREREGERENRDVREKITGRGDNKERE